MDSENTVNGTVAVIGAGAAGISAALRLAENGLRVILVSAQPSARAQSVMAEGGINGALGSDDSCELHAEETLKAGRFLEDPGVIKGMTEAAPGIIKWLDEMGMSFRHDDEGAPALRAFGGQSRKRTAFADASTGRQLMSTLIMLLRKYEADSRIKRLDHHMFIKLLTSGGSASGAVLYDNIKRKFVKVSADAVIAASGGMNGLFGSATGSLTNSGIVTAALFADGIPVADGEFIQYHPTTVKMSGKNMLVTEAVRGEGGRLFTVKDDKRWYFMEELYPEQGNLAPRDVISREEWRLIKSGHEIFLDMTCIDPEICHARLQGVINDCRDYFGIDPLKEPIKIQPGIHFFMGGIKVDHEHRTPLAGLYAAGECACIYHGANRLGGNSLLGALYGGRRAADAAVSDIKSASADSTGHNEEKRPDGPGYSDISDIIKDADIGIDELRTMYGLPKPTQAGSAAALRAKMNAIMQRAMGIERDEAQLVEASDELEKLEKTSEATYDDNAEPYECMALTNSVILARALVKSALERRESRGAHQRSDFPGERDEFIKKTLAYRDKENKAIKIK